MSERERGACGDCGHGHLGRCPEFGCRCYVALPPAPDDRGGEMDAVTARIVRHLAAERERADLAKRRARERVAS